MKLRTFWCPRSPAEPTGPGLSRWWAAPYLVVRGQRALLHDVLQHRLTPRLLQVAVVGHGADHLHHRPLHLLGETGPDSLVWTQESRPFLRLQLSLNHTCTCTCTYTCAFLTAPRGFLTSRGCPLPAPTPALYHPSLEGPSIGCCHPHPTGSPEPIVQPPSVAPPEGMARSLWLKTTPPSWSCFLQGHAIPAQSPRGWGLRST